MALSTRNSQGFFGKVGLVRLGLGLTMLLVLAGCQVKIGGPLCPQVSIAAQLAETDRQYRGLVDDKGLAAAPVTAHIALSGLHGQCRYNDLEKPTSVKLTTTIHIDVSGGKEPAAGPVSFKYFIATIKNDQTVVERREFVIAIPKLGAEMVMLDKEVETIIPLPETELGQEEGSQYRLVYGLVMDAKEVK
ncbi:MAG: hypothetical protein QM523_06115 [Candidatus Pacebacteria bacterium]|nr:hypothetical protein [Candidatus Paceibacterota bacterium]